MNSSLGYRVGNIGAMERDTDHCYGQIILTLVFDITKTNMSYVTGEYRIIIGMTRDTEKRSTFSERGEVTNVSVCRVRPLNCE